MEYLRSIFFAVFLLAGPWSFSQSFFANSTVKVVERGTIFTVEFVLEGAQGSSFQSPTFSNFRKVSGPQQSSQYSNQNGKISQSQTYSYQIRAEKIGTYNIGSAKIRAGGKYLSTKPFEIKVLKEKEITSKDVAGLKDQDLFVRMELEDSMVYVGQQIVLKYMLYQTKNVRSYDVNFESSYDGFFSNVIRNPRNKVEKRKVNGKEYTVRGLREVILFPQQTGKYTIEPMDLTLGISEQKQTKSFFYNSRVKPYPVKTNELIINVRSLPSNEPASFSGGIGKYVMTASCDETRITTDDAITVTMRIIGDGDSKILRPPNQNHITDFDVYDPNTIADNSKERFGVIQNEKIIEYLMVPKKTGNYTIKPEFTFFNTDSNRYETLFAGPFKIAVSKGQYNTKESRAKFLDRQQEIEGIATKTNLRKKKRPFFFSPFHFGLLGIILMGFVYVWVQKKKQIEIDNIDPLMLKQTEAQRIAMGKLSKASIFKEENNSKAFYDEISHALIGYVSDKFNIPNSELSKQNLISKLEDKKVPEEMKTSFSSIIKKAEMAVYGGRPLEGMEEVYSSSVELLSSMETHFGLEK